VTAALWRFGVGLIALPAHVISVFLVFHGAGDAVGPLYRRLFPPGGPGRRAPARLGALLFGCLLLGVPVAIVMNAAALAMVVVVGWIFVPPFRAWDPIAALLVVVAGDLVLRGGGYLQRRLVFRRVPVPGTGTPRPAPDRRPASATRPGPAPVTRPGPPPTRRPGSGAAGPTGIRPPG